MLESYDNIPNNNQKLNNEWLKKGNLSLHVEEHKHAIQEEEINTHYLKSKKKKKKRTSTQSVDYAKNKMRPFNMWLHHVISHFAMIKLLMLSTNKCSLANMTKRCTRIL